MSKGCNCTGSRTMAWMTIGKVTYLSHYDELVASFYKTGKDIHITRHTTRRGDPGLSSAVNRCLSHICKDGVPNILYMSSRRWDQLPVVPLDEYDPEKTNIEKWRLRRTAKMWRTALVQSIVMSDNPREGLRLLQRLDEMVEAGKNGLRWWYGEWTMDQIVTYLHEIYKDAEVPSYYEELV